MKRLMWLGVGMVLLLAASCHSGDGEGLIVESAWGRPSPQGVTTAAFYMTLVNQGDRQDALREVRTTICETVELHQSSMDDEGIMRMAPVPGGRIVVPAGESVVLEPGGLHAMCIGLAESMITGQEVPLTLHFDVVGAIDIVVDIRQEAP